MQALYLLFIAARLIDHLSIELWIELSWIHFLHRFLTSINALEELLAIINDVRTIKSKRSACKGNLKQLSNYYKSLKGTPLRQLKITELQKRLAAVEENPAAWDQSFGTATTQRLTAPCLSRPDWCRSGLVRQRQTDWHGEWSAEPWSHVRNICQAVVPTLHQRIWRVEVKHQEDAWAGRVAGD